VLRRFLRSDSSTFTAVGSGARYAFDMADMPTLRTRFAAWNGTTVPVMDIPVPEPTPAPDDTAVWTEEPVVVMDDIRDPRVRAHVRAVARAQERRLETLLMAAGMHISQMGVTWRKPRQAA
jgi:hypothetical protein